MRWRRRTREASYSRSASRRHCIVRRNGDQYLIKDLGSSNGTLVNGLPITECVLRHGDRIAVSDALFVFATDQAAELPLLAHVTESRDDEALEFATVQQAEPLYRNPQRLLASMQSAKQANHVHALLEINRKAATLREPEELEQALLDAAFQLTPAESAAVLLFEQLDAPATSVTGQNRSSRSSQRCERRVLGMTPEARDLIQQYDWPGNVRELENAIERAVVLGSDSEIQVNDLPETIWESAPAAPGSLTYHAALSEAKKKIVTQALESTGGNYTEAARRLGVHVTYLH